jgi:hypothetical protein
LNLYRFKPRLAPRNTVRSSKLLKLTFVSPYEGIVSDGAEEGSQLSASKCISYINFLSVTGYAQAGPDAIPEDISSLVGTLEQLSDNRHLQDLTDLLSDPITVKAFERSLKGISYLLSSENFSTVAHKFLLRACQVNSSLGESMLNEYFNTTNPVLSSKMVG